jgi:hypothetical protein
MADMEPIYPFTEGAISAMNRLTRGNPRRLLTLADSVIEAGAKRKAIQIDEEFVLGIETGHATGENAVSSQGDDRDYVPG